MPHILCYNKLNSNCNDGEIMNSARRIVSDLKHQRIDLRTTADIKAMLSLAAELIGVSMSAFTLEAAYEKAKDIVKAHEIILLSDQERINFYHCLKNLLNQIKN